MRAERNQERDCPCSSSPSGSVLPSLATQNAGEFATGPHDIDIDPLGFALVTIGFGGLCVPVLWLVFLYWAYQAYQGQSVNIPVVTNFIKQQGWA